MYTSLNLKVIQIDLRCVGVVWTRTISRFNISYEATKDCASHLCVRKDCPYWSQGDADFSSSFNICVLDTVCIPRLMFFLICRWGMKHTLPLRTYILSLQSSGRTNNGMSCSFYVHKLEFESYNLGMFASLLKQGRYFSVLGNCF